MYATPSWQIDSVNAYFARVMNTSLAPYERRELNQDTSNQDRSNLENTNTFSKIEEYMERKLYTEYPNRSYNRKGRGYPDIVIAGVNYLVVVNGSIYALSGTSASAPAFAGMISLINSARYRNGKSSLGWLNPTLYTTKESFANDIVDGDNKCYGFGEDAKSQCCKEGFNGAIGWDPVTGFGAVNFKKLYNVLYNLPNGGWLNGKSKSSKNNDSSQSTKGWKGSKNEDEMRSRDNISELETAHRDDVLPNLSSKSWLSLMTSFDRHNRTYYALQELTFVFVIVLVILLLFKLKACNDSLGFIKFRKHIGENQPIHISSHPAAASSSFKYGAID
jgi:hypothetical protein